MTYIRFFFVLYWFAPFLKFGPLPYENPRCAPGLERYLYSFLFRFILVCPFSKVWTPCPMKILDTHLDWKNICQLPRKTTISRVLELSGARPLTLISGPQPPVPGSNYSFNQLNLLLG